MLDRFDIDINLADNGVFLPKNRGVRNPSGAAVHSPLHTDGYYRKVNELLERAQTREEALDALEGIRSKLLAGQPL